MPMERRRAIRTYLGSLITATTSSWQRRKAADR